MILNYWFCTYVTLNDFCIRKSSDRYRMMYTFTCLNVIWEEKSAHIIFLNIMIWDRDFEINKRETFEKFLGIQKAQLNH